MVTFYDIDGEQYAIYFNITNKLDGGRVMTGENADDEIIIYFDNVKIKTIKPQAQQKNITNLGFI